MSIEQFLIDYRILHEVNEHRGWAHMTCPFCDDAGQHLGVRLDTGWFNCWRCGGKHPYEAVAKLTGLSRKEVRLIWEKYQQNRIPKRFREQREQPEIKIKPFRLPSDCGPLSNRHKQYLIQRKFDPDRLEKEWGLSGTGPTSVMEGISYKHRILIPISWQGRRVSFQTRDVTGKALQKYLACPKIREEIHHKHILYGSQKQWRSTGICVEGATDVWRLGTTAFAVFGIEFTMQQVLAMSSFRRIVVVFDDELQAQKQAKILVTKLRALGKKAHAEQIKGDPADLSQDDADHLVRQIFRFG